MRDQHDDAARSRQPIFKAPFLAMVVATSMPLLFWFQAGLPDFGLGMAFRPTDLGQGHWSGLLTSMLLHGSWVHVMMNAVGALAFGTPVARLFARGGVGPAAFLALYIASGVVAGLGYALCHIQSDVPLVGASGAVFGLIGASTRLIGPVGFIIPWKHPIVLRQAAGWMIANLAIGLIGLAPGMGGAAIAWEAHAFGFVFGLFAVGPLGRILVWLRRR
ncbi:rhomboid family intramembrane serine protease [Brevundimonas vesicularis]|uniref:rhomboid family intramembrane serine protease n=1 Tax=Brevundimonas vesicularis TaxID=41276 RepID=UPI0038D3D09F